MSIADFIYFKHHHKKWRVDHGQVSTRKVENFYWHGPEKFNLINQVLFIFSRVADCLPTKKVWYLRGLRQLLLRRSQKIKGFIPLIGIDILQLRIVFKLYQINLIRPDPDIILDFFWESAAHKNLKNQVLGKLEVAV